MPKVVFATFACAHLVIRHREFFMQATVGQASQSLEACAASDCL